MEGQVGGVYGDARRRNVLAEARAAECDYFVGATDDDETNIMCCIEAGSLGAGSVIAVVHNTDYGGLVEKLGINATVSPHEMVRRQVEGLLHSGALTFANPYLLGYGIEVVELAAQENSPITESPLKECGLPRRSLLASVVRDATPQLPDADFRLPLFSTPSPAFIACRLLDSNHSDWHEMVSGKLCPGSIPTLRPELCYIFKI